MRVRQKITEEVIASNQARRVPGKEIMLSLHPVPPVEVEQVYSIVTETLAKSQLVVSIFLQKNPRRLPHARSHPRPAQSPGPK